MVRHYQKKRPAKYSSEQLLAAVDAVKIRGMKVTQASKRFGIPFSTLYDHELSRSEKSDNTEKPSKSDIVLELSGNCSINGTVTPIRLHLRGYFTKVLQKNRQHRDRQVDKCKVRPKFYGEALTLDEVHDRIVAEK